MQRRGLDWTISLACILVSSTLVWSQSPQFLDCVEVNLLAPGCDEATVDEPRTPPVPPVPDEPLFTLQTMHPSTPPLLVKVFNDPSDANIAAYKTWQHRYLSRTLEVERRLKAYDQQQTGGKAR